MPLTPDNLTQYILGEILSSSGICYGRLAAVHLNIETALACQIPPVILFGQYESIKAFFPVIFGKITNQAFTKEVISLVGVSNYHNILIIDQLEILPRYRGKKLGAQVIQLLANDHAKGCGLVALKAFPLQLQNDLDAHSLANFKDLAQDQDTAFAKLARYYRSLNFKQLGSSKVMIARPEDLIPSNLKTQFKGYCQCP